MKKTLALAGVVGLIIVLLVATVVLSETLFGHTRSGRPVATISLLPLHQEQQLRALNRQLAAAVVEYDGRIRKLESKLAIIDIRSAPTDEKALSRFVDLKIETEKIFSKFDTLRKKIEDFEHLQEKRKRRLDGRLNEIEQKQKENKKARSTTHRLFVRLERQIARLEALIGENRKLSQRKSEPDLNETLGENTLKQTKVVSEKSRQTKNKVIDGVIAYEEGRYKDAFQAWKPLANAGNARAQFHLGALYFEGRGVEEDLPSACNWLKRASANGYCCAITLLNRARDKLRTRIKSGDAYSARIHESACW